jgi:3',5'-cyclic AMP phosphodiesterase CpdA
MTIPAEILSSSSSFILRVAVASDLHAYSSGDLKKNGEPPSHLEVLSGDVSPATNPILGLQQLIRTQNLKAEILACPGDLGDKGSTEGIQFAWKTIHDIGSWLEVEHVLATTGNHDVDSRHLDKNADPHQTVKDLTPSYPTPDETQNDAYFARDFVIIDAPNYRLVLLNSSAHHGNAPQEKNHGRITPATISAIRKRLIKADEKPLSIFLCHHHPHQHSELGLGTSDVMEDGQLLLDLLSSDIGGRWLVLHGHKHHPKITYAAGGTTSPVVFASGSLCAQLFKELQTTTKNQFHLLTIKSEDILRFGLVGSVESWSWAYGKGWEPSQPSVGLPKRCGFGYKGDLSVLARTIGQHVGNDTMLWQDLLSKMPELDFLLPQDFAILRELLRRHHSIGIQEDEGLPYQIGGRGQ